MSRRPPSWIESLLAHFLERKLLEGVIGDLEEKFSRRVGTTSSIIVAKWLYVVEGLLFLRMATAKNLYIQSSLHMFSNFLKIAARNLRRKIAYTIINIAGLSVGIASVILIALFVRHEVSYDRFLNGHERTFRFVTERIYPTHVAFFAIAPQSYADVLAKDFGEIETVTQVMGPFNQTLFTYTKNHNEVIRFDEEHILAADSNFFRVFSFEVLRGNRQKLLTTQGEMVMTESTSRRYFGNDDPLGKMLTTPFGEFKVTAICQDVPGNSHLAFDILVSRQTFPITRMITYTTQAAHTYLRLKEGVTKEALEEKFPAMVETYAAGEIEQNLGKSWEDYKREGNGYKYHLQPVADIHLSTTNYDFSMKPEGNATYVSMLIFTALLIVVLACINFINLATSRSAERAKEVGIRKVMGSVRAQLVGQFFVESILLCLISVVVAVALAYVLLPAFNALTEKQLAFSFDSTTMLSLAGLTVCVGLMAGFYPSIVISVFKPVEVLKGSFVSRPQGRLLREVLVGCQFFISIALLIGTVVINRQLEFVQRRSLGFDTGQVMVVERIGNLSVAQTRTLVDELSRIAGITMVASSTSLPGKEDTFQGIQFQPEGSSEILTTKSMVVGDGLAETLGLELLEGRWFSSDVNDSLAIILNERAVKAMDIAQPIGTKLSNVRRTPSGNVTVQYTIVGVARDFNFKSLRESVIPLVVISNESFQGNAGFVVSKIASNDLPAVVRAVETKWKKVTGDQPFKFSFLDQNIDALYRSEAKAANVFLLFTIISIFIACIGLYAVASYLTSVRAKEIAIRKVLGASVRIILFNTTSGFIRLVAIAGLIAAPLSWYLMNEWLDSFAYRIDITPVMLLLPVVVAFVLVALTVVSQAIRIVMRNPVTSLRE